MSRVDSLSSPPRDMPASLRLRVALGGIMTMIGWLVLGFGLLMSVIFVGNSEFLTAGRFDGPLNTTDGRVVRSERTNMEVNGSYVHIVHFEYNLGDTPQRGVSYCRNQAVVEGETVVVEYARHDPQAARIRGMGTAPFPSEMAFILILPIIGSCLLVYGLWRGRRNLHLLTHGRLAHGQLLRKEATSAQINRQRVFRLTFEFFDAEKQRRQVVARSHRPEALEDQAMEPLLYDPGSQAALLFDAIPGKPRVGTDGRFEPVSTMEILRVLALPAAAGILAWIGTLITF